MAQKKPNKATEKQIVYAAAKRHGIPGWLLWGIYGAENSWDPTNGVQFGLIETTYPQLNGGHGRTVKDPNNIIETSDVAAELIASLAKERGGIGQAVLAYSGNEYSISHPRELASSNSSQGKMVDLFGTLGEIFGNPGGFGGQESYSGAGAGASGLVNKLAEETGGFGLSGLLTPLTTIAEVFKSVGELLFTPEGWVRLGKLIGGAILFLWGLNTLVQGSKVAGKTSSGIGKALEIAAVVK